MRPLIVAIDGPAGSGKSTTARAVARRLGFLYLDTGSMYRAVALALGSGAEEAEEDMLLEVLRRTFIDVILSPDGNRIVLDGLDVTAQIRAPEVGARSSVVSALPAVRQKMVAEQRRIAGEKLESGIGVVIDGRDIGTVVFPDAPVKVFLTASAEKRAQRRHAERASKGMDTDVESVLAEILARDQRDRNRAIAPLRQADDAVLIDSTHLSIETQVRAVESLVHALEGRDAPPASSAGLEKSPGRGAC